MQSMLRILFALALALVAASCGDDDSTANGDATPSDEVNDADTVDGSDDVTDETDDNGDDGNSGGGGTLTFDGEEITLDSARCTFEEQDAAAGGGTIEFVAQGTGTNAAGETVLLDVTRFSEESMFAGDDVTVDIGEIATATRFSGNEPAGTVSEDGSTVSATDFPVTGSEDFNDERNVSFSVACG